jgi:hypothetical protein
VIDVVHDDLSCAIARHTAAEPASAGRRRRAPTGVLDAGDLGASRRLPACAGRGHLADWAAEQGVVLAMLAKPGDYVFPAPRWLRPALGARARRAERRIRAAMSLGSRQAQAQDLSSRFASSSRWRCEPCPRASTTRSPRLRCWTGSAPRCASWRRAPAGRGRSAGRACGPAPPRHRLRRAVRRHVPPDPAERVRSAAVLIRLVEVLTGCWRSRPARSAGGAAAPRGPGARRGETRACRIPPASRI